MKLTEKAVIGGRLLVPFTRIGDYQWDSNNPLDYVAKRRKSMLAFFQYVRCVVREQRTAQYPYFGGVSFKRNIVNACSRKLCFTFNGHVVMAKQPRKPKYSFGSEFKRLLNDLS